LFGQFKNGKLDGIVSVITSDGLKQQGYIKDRMMNGIGKKINSDGSIYLGEF